MKIRIRSPKANEALWQIICQELETHKLALPETAYTNPELSHLSDYYDNLQAALHIYRKVGFKQLPQPLHPGIHTMMD